MCTAGDFENLREGDYKTIELTTGETVVCQIAGIDTYYLSDVAGSDIGHHLDFVSKDCMSTTVQWSTSATNNGNSSIGQPYLASNLYDWLNSTVYNTMPSDLINIVSEKKAVLENRYSSTTSLTDSTGWLRASMGYIWVPSEYEIFRSQIWGTKGWSAGYATQYPLFIGATRHRLKRAGNNSSKCSWWLSTVRSGSSINVIRITDYGSCSSIEANDTSTYAPLCFRIAA